MEADALEDDILRIDQIAFTSGTSTGQPKGCPRHVAFQSTFASYKISGQVYEAVIGIPSWTMTARHHPTLGLECCFLFQTSAPVYLS